jgi:hypothetical protein
MNRFRLRDEHFHVLCNSETQLPFRTRFPTTQSSSNGLCVILPAADRRFQISFDASESPEPEVARFLKRPVWGCSTEYSKCHMQGLTC